MHACMHIDSGGKKISDSLKILHNLKHYHEISVEKSLWVLKGVVA